MAERSIERLLLAALVVVLALGWRFAGCEETVETVRARENAKASIADAAKAKADAQNTAEQRQREALWANERKP